MLLPNASVVLFYPKTYELPVGYNDTVGPERSRCPGELFQPKGLRAPRRKHRHCWYQTHPLRGSIVHHYFVVAHAHDHGNALVCGYCMLARFALSLTVGSGARVLVAECHPFCALQACLRWPLRPLGEIDIFVSSTGIFNIISAIKHVDHDELWLALLREFRQSGAWLQVAAIETAVSETDIFPSSTCTTSSLWEPVIILYGLVPVTLAARLFRSSRTVYIFIYLRMPVVLLKFPLVAIKVPFPCFSSMWCMSSRIFTCSRV